MWSSVLGRLILWYNIINVLQKDSTSVSRSKSASLSLPVLQFTEIIKLFLKWNEGAVKLLKERRLNQVKSFILSTTDCHKRKLDWVSTELFLQEGNKCVVTHLRVILIDESRIGNHSLAFTSYMFLETIRGSWSGSYSVPSWTPTPYAGTDTAFRISSNHHS